LRFTSAVLVVLPVACSSHPGSQAASADGGGDDATSLDGGTCPTGDDTTGEAGAAPFQDVGPAAGFPALGDRCLAMEDFDGDGHLDVLLVTAGVLKLFAGDGKGSFQGKTVPLPSFPGALGPCAVGDVDADGKPDVVLAAFGTIAAHYLHNAGGGAFDDLQTFAPPFSAGFTLTGVGLADFDGDGWLDVVFAPWGLDDGLSTAASECGCVADGYACVLPGTRCLPPPVVYTNTGAGGFMTAARSLGNATDCGPANTNALGIADYDGDGLPDVFIANDWGTDRLYLNSSGMQFTDVWSTLGTKGYNHAMGVAFEDFDLDGRLDAYVSDIGSGQLYLGTTGGLAYHTQDWGVAAPTRFQSGWAPLGEDFDSDGWTDLFVQSAALVRTYEDLTLVGQGGQLQPIQQFDLLLLNAGGHGFTPEWVAQTQQAEPRPSYGTAAVGDFDEDGRLDVAEAIGTPDLEGGSIGTPMRFELLHNVSPAQHWIDVRLQGHAPNLDGIGASVTLSRSGSPSSTRYVQRAHGSVGSSWPVAHFGLGASTAIDSIAVRWPGGSTQTVQAPAADAVLMVTQP
jgi:hypothetical protein